MINSAFVFENYPDKDWTGFSGWLQFKREHILQVMDKFELDFDKLISVRINDEFWEFLYCGNKQFSQIKILRHVLAPYVKDGKPRNWFKGKDEEPLRWTGISNIFYLKGDKAEFALSSLLSSLIDEDAHDSRFMVEVEENGERFIGFCPIKKNNLPETIFSS